MSSDTPEYARVDHDREARCGVPEAVFAEGKTPREVVEIARRMDARGGAFLVTRAGPDHARALEEAWPGGGVEYHERARVARRMPSARPAGRAGILVVCAGTSDLAVAEEARWTAEFLGEAPATLYDVGVAGVHRLLGHRDLLRAARVLIVIAGMEGALPSVVGGLVAAPLIAVPTSVGYGTGAGGVAPVLSMLNSCVPGVLVVNIDNGFGAAVAAAKINRMGNGG